MGMDVIGRKATSEAGKYFRANVWSWRPIHALCFELCGDLLDEKILAGMAYNGGAGPQSAKTCRQMADRFDKWLEHNTEGHSVDLGMHVTADGRLITPEMRAADPNIKTRSAYRVTDDHLKEWVAFLRDCGGFEVW